MSDEDQDTKALQAAALYANDTTFADIAKKLEVSKSHAQVLTRRGIALSLSEREKNDPGDVVEDNPGIHAGLETQPPQPQYVFPPQDPRAPLIFPPQDPRAGIYMLETDGIGRRVMLTPADIMIFDIFRGGGFKGDLSAFISDSINFMYNSVRPAER